VSKEIKNYMTTTPHTIGHDISVEKAHGMMREFHCHHLPVLNGGHLVGLVSERDLRMALALTKGEDTPVERLMTDEPVVVEPTADIKYVLDLMIKETIGSVIVRAQEGQPWGIFTISDALKVARENI